MQLDEERRYDDETFHFTEGGELAVDRESLPPVYPEVEVLEGSTAIVTYTNRDGEVMTPPPGDSALFPCSRVDAIQTGGETKFHWTEDDRLIYSFEDEHTGEYVPAEGDMFILKPNTYDEDATTQVHPATEPLPELKGKWEIEAVITADNRLITWGQNGHQQLVERCLALQLMESTADYTNLNRSGVTGISIVAFFGLNKTVQTYFKVLRERTGADFTPTEEVIPTAHSRGIPMGLTDELAARYRSED